MGRKRSEKTIMDLLKSRRPLSAFFFFTSEFRVKYSHSNRINGISAEEKVDSSLEYLILASDGLRDLVTNEEAVAMIKPLEDVEEAAKRLMQEAYQGGSADNITCVVVCFLMNQVCSSLLAPCNYPSLDSGFVHWSSGGYPNM
ncbi:probable protein phosphatase 2C 59 [Vicia villosa]|uniref:probable protein phosphatase 2C 59 n=1 Tax=Vicia villosa TaxID=3911 RepID=UPI00273CDE1B|nr:probable protein phosphatase 2C 59 [Vicia villosa]